jgi:hypothetical protein
MAAGTRLSGRSRHLGRQHVSDATATDLEILTILAVTGFFLTPVIERAIEAGERPPPSPAAQR